MTECSWIIAPFYHPNKDIKNDFFKKYAVNSFANTIHIMCNFEFSHTRFPHLQVKRARISKNFSAILYPIFAHTQLGPDLYVKLQWTKS